MNAAERERRQICDAVAAVIAGAIEDMLAEHPDASPEAQARKAVRVLRALGWHITAAPLCALQRDERTPDSTTTPADHSATALRSA
ncbi:hypothetical protein ACGFWE_13790 [Streptomyces sp. NPDC048523]|uniref:hypothetical protein n=1 Tax=unclassified Streptomyces TaxID=2593676 RepID=UPI0037164C3D|nr:hypothetical protein OG331_31915 [Streptomyces sp. NBC_01017]